MCSHYEETHTSEFICAAVLLSVAVAFFVETFPVLYVIGSVEEGRLLTLEDFDIDDLPNEYDAY